MGRFGKGNLQKGIKIHTRSRHLGKGVLEDLVPANNFGHMPKKSTFCSCNKSAG